MTTTLSLFQRFSRYPMGTLLFSKALTLRAPYFSTIHPHITKLQPGSCSVEIKDRRSIRNHIGTINAGALCTLSELAGGLAVETALPDGLRWIPKEMTVQYVKKARGRLICECSIDKGALHPGDVRVPFEIKDSKGDTVLKTAIVFYISETKPAN